MTYHDNFCLASRDDIDIVRMIAHPDMINCLTMEKG